MPVRLLALRAGHHLPPPPPQEDTWYLFLLEAESTPRAVVRLEGLGQLKKIHLIGTRTRDLPASSIVPQPITLPRAPRCEYVEKSQSYHILSIPNYNFVITRSVLYT
jgi:hypothetical protein